MNKIPHSPIVFFLYLTICLFIIGCDKKGTPQTVSDALDDFRVEKLFKKDRCTVYRFSDDGRFHYFTDCTETISTISTTQSYPCGKSLCYQTENKEDNIK